MGFFDSDSDSSNQTSGSDQGTQGRDDAVSSNINLTAGDDQTAHVTIDDSLTQIDNSSEDYSSTVTDSYNTTDNSVRTTNQVDNSVTDNSVYQVDQSVTDNSVRTTNVDRSRTDNSVYQVDNSVRDDSVHQVDNSVTDNSVSTSQIDESTTVTDSYNTRTTNRTTNQYDQSRTTITYTDQGAIAGAVTIADSAMGAMRAQTDGLFATVDDLVEGYGAQSDAALTTLAGSFESSIEQISSDSQSQTESVLTDTFKFLAALAAVAGAVMIFR